MRKVKKRHRQTFRWQITLGSLAIIFIACAGFWYILNGAFSDTTMKLQSVTGAVFASDDSKEAEELDATMLPKSDVLELPVEATPKPTQEPTPEPTPKATPEPTPEPTPTPLPLKGLKIGIDPGHQEKGDNTTEEVSPGSREKKPKVASGTSGVKTKVPEYVRVLEISMMLRDELVTLGADVLMTREVHEVNISNIQRAEMMNRWGADLVLRIHCNGVSQKSANGIGLYVKPSGEGAEASHESAKLILDEMVKATGARKDGLFKRDIYSGLNWSTVPSILVETGYMTNPAEDEKLADPDYQKLLCDGMVRGIGAYFQREVSTQVPALEEISSNEELEDTNDDAQIEDEANDPNDA